MFAKYQYNGGAQLSEVYADILAILTGATDVNALSDSCNKPSSDIVATVAAGWSLTTGGQVAPVQKTMPVTGTWNAKPVSNGTVTLWPCLGSNKVMRSTDNGDTWTAITLPQSLGTVSLSSVQPVENLIWIAALSTWVLTDGGNSVNYVFTSADGLSWTQRTTATAQQWGTPVWNGSILVINTINSSQAIVTSTDGVAYTYAGTALPVSASWGIPVYGNGIWIVCQNIAATVLATSTNGTTWTSRTVPSFYYTRPQWNGAIWLSSSANSSNAIMSSADAITWTSRALATSIIWRPPQWTGTYWLICSIGGSGYVMSSADGLIWVSRLTSVNINGLLWVPWLSLWVAPTYNGSTVYTSPEGIVWTSKTIPSIGQSNAPNALFCTGNLIVMIYASTSYAIFSHDAVTWVAVSTLPFSSTLTSNPFENVFAQYGTTVYLYSVTANTDKVAMLQLNALNNVIQAPHADGVTYKKVLLNMSCNNLTLRTAEAIGVESITNPVYQSDAGDYAQRLDLVNGGAIYLAATNRYLVAYSFLPAAPAWGSLTGGGFTAIHEYSRDDDWNVGSGGPVYPTHVWMNSGLFTTGWYSPRMQLSGTADVTGSAALLTPMITAPFAKQVLNASSVATPPAIEVRLRNDASFTYGILGGILLGGVKQTVTSFGATADEVQIGATNYFVLGGGTTNPTVRMLVPKA